jgi:uncharacterized protein YabE (DUF348 family)
LGLATGALTLLILGWRQTGSPLVIEVDGQRFEVHTHAKTVGEALRRNGVGLFPEDIVSPGLQAPLQEGLVVEVQRSRPVTVKADGQVSQLRTHATTVGQALQETGIAMRPADEILLNEQLVSPSTPLSPDGRSNRTVTHRGGSRLEGDSEASIPPLISLRRATQLILDDSGITTTLHTTLPTVGSVLHENHVKLYLGDLVTPSLQQQVAPGMKVVIERSVPIQIMADGHTIHTRTRAETVAGALGEAGIALVGKDEANPTLETVITSGTEIRITRIREEFLTETDPIPFEMIWVPDPQVEIDNISLVQEGQVGLNKRRFRVTYRDGQEVERGLEDSWAAQPPVTKTMAYGTKIVVRKLDTPDGPMEYWRRMRVYTTSYRPASAGKSRDHPRYGYTRLGVLVKRGIVATDPEVIPLRTWLYVPGYGKSIAADTGGGVKGKFVDLGFSDDDYESWHWWTDVYLLTPVPPADEIRWILPDYPKFPDRKRR